MLSRWNQQALPSDTVYASPGHVALLSRTTAGKKVMYLQGTDVPQLLALAQKNQVGYVNFNNEAPKDCASLIAAEQTTYQLVHKAGLTMVFSPTEVMLEKCYREYPQILQYTDVIIAQSQRFQVKDPDMAHTVRALVHNLKQIRNIPVWVQVSVNPPANRTLDAQSVIQTINELEDGNGDNPDEIHVFYSPENQHVAEQVLDALRPPHS